METFIFWAIGLAIIIGVFVVNVRRGNQHGSHYHDGFYHGTHDSGHSGDWGGRDMSHDHHHGGYESDSGGNGGDGGGGGGGDSGGGDGGGGGGE